jgi:hypothetical protein
MPKLTEINFARNQLISIPPKMFYNISNIESFDVFLNNLTAFELWLIQIKTSINYLQNPVIRLTNNYRVDLSKYQSSITPKILLNNGGMQIDFDDSLFEMFNRCCEINSKYTPIVKKAIAIIDDNNPGLLNWKCSCEQYYLREYVISIKPEKDFSTWICEDGQNITYREMCQNKSSFNVANVEPRLCKINPLESCFIVEPVNYTVSEYSSKIF